MEFFVPCTRMHDLMRAWSLDPRHYLVFPENMGFEEVELRTGAPNVGVDFFHHPDFTFDDFWQLTRRKIVWMGPEIFVDSLVANRDIRDALTDFRQQSRPLFSVRPANSLDTGGDNELQVYSLSVTDATTAVCDYVFQLMTRSNTIWTHLEFNVLSSVSTLALSPFLNNAHDSCGNIRFVQYDLSAFSPEYLLVFQVSAGPHHRLELEIGTIMDWTVPVTNLFQSCQCAIALYCRQFPVPYPLITDILRENCNIVDLTLDELPDIDGLARALAENKSLVRLAVDDVRISDANWTVLCQSLSRHPRLVHLRLLRTFPHVPGHNSTERKIRRTHVFLEMLQANTVLQELDALSWSRLPHDEFDERLLSDVIQPYFRHLPHVRAFAGPYRAQVFVEVLCKVDGSPALAWMLIRNNIPAILGEGEENEQDMVPDT
jgi:hypothetical protein